MENCIFCKIIKKEIPSYKLYEDDKVIVFLDINPESNGHCLIVPKTHFVDVTDIDEKILYHVNKISKEIYNLLKEKFNFIGLKIVQNNGFIQDVKHYHMHLIPVYNNNIRLSVEEVYKKIKG